MGIAMLVLVALLLALAIDGMAFLLGYTLNFWIVFVVALLIVILIAITG